MIAIGARMLHGIGDFSSYSEGRARGSWTYIHEETFSKDKGQIVGRGCGKSKRSSMGEAWEGLIHLCLT